MVLTLLIRLNYLADAKSGDRKAVGEAMSRMMADTARNYS
jgi:hypothetical protein